MNPPRHRQGMLLGVLIVIVGAFALSQLLDTDTAVGSLPERVSAHDASADSAVGTRRDVRAPAMIREAAGTPDSPPADFTSKLDDDDASVADPVRDGLTFIVRHEGGAPCAAMGLTVYWRKGFGLYGKDRGRTDALGRFPTTVRSVDQIEHVEALHPEFGEIGAPDDLLPMANDANAVLLLLPRRVPLRVRVVDLDRQPIAGVALTASTTAANPAPREYRFYVPSSAILSSDRGHTKLLVPPGIGDCDAKREGFSQLASPKFMVGPSGGETTILMIDHRNRREVAVSVTLPPGVAKVNKVSAFSRDLPAELASRFGVLEKQGQRSFDVRAKGAQFVVAVDPLPWRLVAYADGCEPGIVDLLGPQPVVRVNMKLRAPGPPKVLLIVDVTSPDGEPVAGAQVRLHKTPDLVYGSKHHTDRDGRFVFETKPGLKVCVSAIGSNGEVEYARAIGGPVETKRGEQRIELRLRPARRLTGRVIDRSGTAVSTWVRLRRPADALRSLGKNVPVTLTSSPTSDRLVSSEHGRFEFDDLYPGPHVVWAEGTDGQLPGLVHAMPGQDVTVVLGQGIEGYALIDVVVLDDDTGAPLPECKVQGLGYTNKEGLIRRAILPRSLKLLVYAKERVATPWGPRDIGPGPLSIEIRVKRSRPVFVRVLDVEGRPVANAEVRAIGSDGKPLELVDAHGTSDGNRAQTDIAGRTEMRGLPAGPLRLRVNDANEQQQFTMPATAGRDAVFDLIWVR